MYIIDKSVNCNLELFSSKTWSINTIAILVYSPSPYVTKWCKMCFLCKNVFEMTYFSICKCNFINMCHGAVNKCNGCGILYLRPVMK